MSPETPEERAARLTPSTSSIGRHLVVIAVFGAARADATPGQLDNLRDIASLLREPSDRFPLDDIVRRVFECMGRTWVPAGEFGEWIDQLIAERDRGEWTPGDLVRRAT